LPKVATPATDPNAIRPFHVNVPEAELAQAHQRDKVARAGTGHGCIARRAARDGSEYWRFLPDAELTQILATGSKATQILSLNTQVNQRLPLPARQM
jgi:hypothetical protein